MLPSDFEKKQKQDLIFVKISNGLLECFVQKKNIIAIKIILYLSIKSKKINFSKDKLTLLRISIDDLSKVIKTDRKTIIRNVEKMQQTSITFVTGDKKQLIESISVIPSFKYEVGKDIVEIEVFNKVLELIKDVENRFTIINASNLIQLKNLNTIKMIGLLKMIDGYSQGVAKKRVCTVFELNNLFDVNYKNYYEFERKILKPVINELNEESSLTFFYDFNFEQKGRGRPSIKEIIIYLKNNENRQLKMF